MFFNEQDHQRLLRASLLEAIDAIHRKVNPVGGYIESST